MSATDVTTPSTDKKKDWLPLESDPELMTKYFHALGADIPHDYQFHELFGLDEELLGMIPGPVRAVLVLFPISTESELFKEEEEKQLLASPPTIPEKLFYTKQTVGNACGTIGLIHAVLNNRDVLQLDPAKFFFKYYEASSKLSPLERAVALEKDDNLEVEHGAIAAEGGTDAEEHMNTNLHFIAFVHCDGKLWELDGRKVGPVQHGNTSQETLLKDSVAVIKQFIDRAAGNVLFNITALAPAE